MSQVTVRPAVAAERDILIALQWRASLANTDDRDSLLAHPDAIELPCEQIRDNAVLVAEQNGRIKGFAVVLHRDDGNIELDGLFVEPDCWRQGIGKLLVAQCANMARRAGARYLHVVGNPHAEQFYVACGFKTVGRQSTRFGTGLLMKHLIRDPHGHDSLLKDDK